MQANGYDIAAEAPIINTYVPINFGELYRIGSAQKAAVDDAIDKLNTAVTTFGEFRSPSEVDIKRYYDNSIGKVSDLIESAASNPDLMKDAGFRSQLQSRLNNIDYSLLSSLKESADNMRTRLKAKAELEAQGLYQEWFDDSRYTDLSNWDTSRMGIMNNLAPAKFESLESIGSAYTKDLKPTFYKGQAPNSGTRMPYTNWMAISFDDIKRSLEQHAYDIKNTPAGQKWYNRMRNEILTMYPNATQEDIDNAFINELAVRQSDKMIETPVTDTASLKLALSNSKNGDTPQNGLRNLTESVEADARTVFSNLFKDIDESIKQKYTNAITQAEKEGKTLKSAEDIIMNMSRDMDKAYKQKLNELYLVSSQANNSHNAGINDVINALSSGIGNEANEVLTRKNTQTGKTTSEGYRVGNSTSDFLLRTRLFDNLTGRSSLTNNKLADDIEKGRFKKFFVSGVPQITTDGNNIYHNEYVFIPESQLRDSKTTGTNDTGTRYTSREIAGVQGDWVMLDEDQVRITESTDTYGDTRTSVNTALKAGRYLRIPVNTIVPREGTDAIENDALWSSKRGLSQDQRDYLQMRSEFMRFQNIE